MTEFSTFYSGYIVEVRGTTPYPYTQTEKLLSELLAPFGSRLGSPNHPQHGQDLAATPVLARRSWECGTVPGDLLYYRLAHPDVIRAASVLGDRPQPVRIVIEALTDPAKFIEHVHLEHNGLAVDVHLYLGVLMEVRVGQVGATRVNYFYDMLEKAAQLKRVQGLPCDGTTDLLPELKRLSGKPFDQPDDAKRFLRETFAFLFPPGGGSTEKPQEEEEVISAASSI